ncbi:hypothetical protein ACP26L_25470 [Paenibacillus sp. S-38]|uniref:hypothetical protein n=1 Tax=Paenibacillus sp. S-38 TaxID=3416710 RepID=UPI003CE874EC
MAKRNDEYLEREAKRIGYQKMLTDLAELMEKELSEAQRVAITDQQEKLRELQLLGVARGSTRGACGVAVMSWLWQILWAAGERAGRIDPAEVLNQQAGYDMLIFIIRKLATTVLVWIGIS